MISSNTVRGRRTAPFARRVDGGVRQSVPVDHVINPHIGAIDVPNRPSKLNPLGEGFHRVYAHDIQHMEEQIEFIARALHLY